MEASNFREVLRASLVQDPAVEPPPGDRLAAVLVPLLDGPEPSVLFTKRTEELSRHPGEVSFPGGILHDDDPSLMHAALRETEEELGISPNDVEVLGALAPVHTHVSGILVTPFVGVLRGRPAITPNETEIAAVLEVPVMRLVEIENEVEMEGRGERFTTYAYEAGGHTIWGATGHILHDFVEIVRRVRPWG